MRYNKTYDDGVDDVDDDECVAFNLNYCVLCCY